MTKHVLKPHTAAEMRRFSDQGHAIEGAIMSGSGTLMLLDSLVTSARLQGASSNLLAAAGALLGLGLVAGSLEHGGPIAFFKTDLQQRQHLEMAGLITAGGLARKAGRFGSPRMGCGRGEDWPDVSHPRAAWEWRGCGDCTRQAPTVGQDLAAAATVTAGELLRSTWLRTVGSGLLIASGVQLATYREPEGAYEEHVAHHDM